MMMTEAPSKRNNVESFNAYLHRGARRRRNFSQGTEISLIKLADRWERGKKEDSHGKQARSHSIFLFVAARRPDLFPPFISAKC